MKNKIGLIKIFLLVWLIGSFVAFVLHFFYPQLVSNFSLRGISVGWQREIALFNIGLIFAIIFSLVKNNKQIYKFMVLILIVISLLLGTNHLFALIINNKIIVINLLGFVLNYIMLVFGLFILRRNDVKKDR